MFANHRLLLTGGNGYIGSICAYYLAKLGFDITIIDANDDGHKDHTSSEFIQANICDVGALDRIFESKQYDAVLHFAGKIQVGESVGRPLYYYENNVLGTLRLLASMKRYSIKNLVFSSTAAVYGIPEYLPLDERHPIAPLSPYGHSKAMAEQLIIDSAKAYGIKAMILRYFNAAGAIPESGLGECHKPETHLIPLAIQSILNQENNFKVFGTDYDTPDGSCIRDYIHVRDLAKAHLCALNTLFEGGSGGIYNIGTGVGHSVIEVLEMLSHLTNTPLSYLRSPPRLGDAPILYTSASKANKALNWQAEHDLGSILKDAIEFQEQVKT